MSQPNVETKFSIFSMVKCSFRWFTFIFEKLERRRFKTTVFFVFNFREIKQKNIQKWDAQKIDNAAQSQSWKTIHCKWSFATGKYYWTAFKLFKKDAIQRLFQKQKFLNISNKKLTLTERRYFYWQTTQNRRIYSTFRLSSGDLNVLHRPSISVFTPLCGSHEWESLNGWKKQPLKSLLFKTDPNASYSEIPDLNGKIDFIFSHLISAINFAHDTESSNLFSFLQNNELSVS